MEPSGRNGALCDGFAAEIGVINSSDWEGSGFDRWWRALCARLVAPFPAGMREPFGPRWPRWVRLPSLLGSSALVWMAIVLALLVLSTLLE
jgi:hypothetical protein